MIYPGFSSTDLCRTDSRRNLTRLTAQYAKEGHENWGRGEDAESTTSLLWSGP